MNGEALHRCPQCGSALMPAKPARYGLSSVWICEGCGGEFEVSVRDKGFDMPANQDEFEEDTASPQSISLTDELRTNSAWMPKRRSSESTRSHVDELLQSRATILAGLVIIVLIASCSLAWVVRSLLNPNLSRSSPQIVNSSATIPDSIAKIIRETAGEANAEDKRLQHVHSTERSNKANALPESSSTTIEGWRLGEVANGIAVLEGPNGSRIALNIAKLPELLIDVTPGRHN
jgi:hypothetical protein